MRLAALALTAVLLVLFTAGSTLAKTTGCVHDKPCHGTGADDHIKGTDGNDEILARDGRDFVNARAGSDVVRGGSGADGDEYVAGGLFGDSPGMSTNSGRDGNDMVFGGDGKDTLYGFGGSDFLVGGGKADYIFAEEFRVRMGRGGIAKSKNPGIDTVSGGMGGDHIEAVDGRMDIIDCGGGKDAVWFDEGLDVVLPGCELENIIHGGG